MSYSAALPATSTSRTASVSFSAASPLQYGPSDLENALAEGEVIITRTDLKGRITYANDAFLAYSGYSLQEVVGRAHSIVRHPQMPRAAYADLWRTLQAGKPWSGIVKNLCKDGRFYWVRAYVTPIVTDGQVTGYLSVRVRPSREEVERAIAVYRTLDAGSAQSPEQARHAAMRAPWILREGRAIRRFLPARALHWLMSRPVSQRMAAYCITTSSAAAVAAFSDKLQLPGPVAFVAAAVAIGFPWVELVYLHSRLLQPLQRVSDTARQVINGNCMARFAEEGDDAVRGIAGVLNQMSIRSVGILRDVHSRAEAMAEMSQRMQATSEGLSASVEQQAASIAQVTHSVSNLSAGVEQTTKSTETVTDLSRKSAEMVQTGAEVSHEVSGTFHGIQGVSKEMDEMLQSIQSIAMQTKLLALNAGIEAARAGHAGAGFAVIAKEVRALSERVSSSAAQIATLNEGIHGKLDAAKQAVVRMDHTVESIRTSCGQVVSLAGDVANTTRMQMNALRQVACAMAEMELATHHNATSAEASAGVAQELGVQASRLRDAFAA